MCRTLLRSVFAFSWAVTRAEKSGLGSKFGVVLVSLLISPLCLAATSSDIRIRSIECYNGTDWARPDSPADPSFHTFRPDLLLAPGHPAFAVSCDGVAATGSWATGRPLASAL